MIGVDIYTFIMGTVLPLAVTAFVVWSIVEAARRPSSQYALARLKKNAWIAILIGALFIVGNGYFWSFFVPFRTLLYIAALFAALYFLGPECHRMGPPNRRGRSQRNSGGW